MLSRYVALALLALTTVSAITLPANETVFVSFPEALLADPKRTTANDKLNGFRYNWREKCLNLCGHEQGVGNGMHHVMSVSPLRVPNTAAVSCYCCVKDPSGDCYSSKNPYNKSNPDGPVVWMTARTLAKAGMFGTKAIDSSLISKTNPSALKLSTREFKKGAEVRCRWTGSTSQIGGTFWARIDSGKTRWVVKLINGAFKSPDTFSGKISIVIQSSSSGSASSLYALAQTTVAAQSTRTKRDLMRLRHKQRL